MPETKLTPQDEVVKALALLEPEIEKALPPQIKSAKFIRVAQTAIRMTPTLALLDRASLYASFHKCAADGLLPDGREAAIVEFKGKAVYMPMVQGICKKARNSGEIKDINALVVYQNDEYDHWIDESGEHFKHRPKIADRGNPILTYAFCRTKDAGMYFEEIDMAQMDAIQKSSRAQNGPWSGPFKSEMMRKSALRRLLKYRVPSSTDLDELIRRDDDLYDLSEEKEPPKKAEKTSSRLKDIVETTTEPAAQEGPTEAQEEAELSVAAGDDLPI